MLKFVKERAVYNYWTGLDRTGLLLKSKVQHYDSILGLNTYNNNGLMQTKKLFDNKNAMA